MDEIYIHKNFFKYIFMIPKKFKHPIPKMPKVLEDNLTDSQKENLKFGGNYLMNSAMGFFPYEESCRFNQHDLVYNLTKKEGVKMMDNKEYKEMSILIRDYLKSCELMANFYWQRFLLIASHTDFELLIKEEFQLE